MKKTGKIFVSMMSLGMLFSNVAMAATEVVEESKDGMSMKYIFIGAAVIVIGLLLFLGYKMDTKDSGGTKVSHKAEKAKKKLSEKAQEMQQNAGTYEESEEEAYEEDGEIFDNEDLNDSTEYNNEEEESSLFAASNEEEDDGDITNEIEGLDDEDEEPEDDNSKFDTSSFTTNVSISPDSEDEKEEEPEATGEEFDTSIIDGLDDEDEPKNSFDETMLFNNNSAFSATGSSLEDEIDNLDNIKGSESLDTDGIDTGDDSFINELKSFEEPESSFGGFTVSSDNDDKFKEFKDVEEPKKTVKPEEPKVELNEENDFDISNDGEMGFDTGAASGFEGFSVSEPTTASLEEDRKDEDEADLEENKSADMSMDNDFLSQMEANLQKSQEARKNKKTTTSSKDEDSKNSTSSTKKTTTKKK